MMDDYSLRGKVAVVTGGGSGLGKAISLLFAERGASIAVADIDPDKAEEVRNEIETNGGTAAGVPVDVTSVSQVQDAVGVIREEFGTIHILVNCAGINEFKPVYEFSTEEWEKIRAVNLDGPWHISQAVLPAMMEQRYGKIVNIASAAGIRATPHAAPYSTAKHGLVGLTKTFAVDLGPFNINVNCICPASVDSPLLRASTSEAYRQRMIERLPLGRLGKAADIAHAALFLASDAAAWITGAILPVDGGLTCCSVGRHQE